MIETADSLIPVSSHPPKEVKSSWLQVFFFRLFLLGIGGTLAAFIGFFLAFIYPNTNVSQPFVVTLWKSLQREPENLSTEENASLLSELTPQTQQQLQTDVQRLQQQYAQLSDRLAKIELQLGTPSPNSSLESRLDRLQQQLSPESLSNLNSGDSQASNASEGESETLKVTLPSNILFKDQNTTLEEGANTLLEEFVTDLQDYSGATIVIGAHTDVSEDAAVNRELSYYRARTIQQYLSESLGEGYHWVIVGYGETRPLVSQTTNLDPQLNNRVEITLNKSSDAFPHLGTGGG